jgi:hypothetical protein
MSLVEIGFVVVVVVDDADVDGDDAVVVVAVVDGVDEAFSPSSNLSKVSRGTLHPHPFKSEYCVRRQFMSRPCSSAINGLRRISGLLA